MKELKFVDVGEGITEGNFQKWLVKDGESVKEDQPIAQIETDKAVVNVPAPISGMLKQVAKEGTQIKVGDTIAMIGTTQELKGPAPAASSPAPMQQKPQEKPEPQKQSQPAPQPVAKQPSRPAEILATPYVRKLARDNNIDLSTITGTGPNGRVLENDVRSHLMSTASEQKPVPKFSELLEEKHGEAIERLAMSQTRKTIAKNMELSATIPRAVHMDLVDASHIYRITSTEKEKAQKLGVKLTFLSFIIKATVAALKENPRLNSSYDKEKQEIILKKYYNIGLAAEASDGLKVIVIRDADKKSILEIAKDLQELHKKILDNTISIAEMRDSTFTITNIGSLGGGYLSVPMINYPEAAILGVHLVRDTPVVESGEIKIGKVLPVSLAFDHRIVDGAEAALFTNKLKEYLEDPEFLEML